VAYCDLPLTGAGVVDLVITDLAVLRVNREARCLDILELAPEVTVGEVAEKTGAAVRCAWQSEEVHV